MDSSVAAFLLRDAGVACEAVFLRLYDGCPPDGAASGTHRIINGARFLARDVAGILGIPFSILDFRPRFIKNVIDPFVASYLAGDTPNPCVDCNRYIKFGELVDYAGARGFAHIATGHYARIEQDRATGRFLLAKGADASKDQSYMLYSLTQRQLARVKFPVGGMLKSAVRSTAENLGLPNAKIRESQDICFIQNGRYMDFIKKYSGLEQPDGPIVDNTGAAVGRHKGAAGYTIGQRKGLGLAMPDPVYVYAKSVAENKVYVGAEHLLYSKHMDVRDINLIPLIKLSAPMRVRVKTRYRHAEQPAVIEQISDDSVRVEFDAPQRAITGGQAAVFYDGDMVVGGGTIVKNPDI